ncbi:MAG: O-GlcNAc transferase [Thermodesulfobacteriota bacterium]|nr:MAG: O-GlcNAc transferase [Thermodesulfobacteriota bacterium]
MAKKKNKASKKNLEHDHNISREQQNNLVGNKGPIDSLIGNRLIVSVFLFVLSFMVFVPSLSSEFVWDDVSYIQKKAHSLNFSKLGPGLILPKIANDNKAGKYFRPVHQASLIIDNEIWDTSPFGFHLTNIILHCVSTVLLYFLVLLLLKEFHVKARELIALISSILFAVYPLHVESVTFISARGDILAAMFLFLGFSFYILSYRRIFYLFLAGICFLLALLSKEVAIVFPIIILSFDFLSQRLFNRSNLFKYAIIALIAIFYFLIRSKSYLTFGEILNKGSSELSQGFLSISEILLNTYLFYVIKLVFPYNLNPFIDSGPNWGVIGLIVSIILVLVLFVAVLISIKRNENITAFSILWILATLLPAAIIAIFPLALTKLADRFLYIPSAGICILLGYIIYKLSVRFNRIWYSYALTAILAISFIVVAVNAQKIWKNDLSLWEYAVSKSPGALGAKINYADALRNSKNPTEALKQYMEVYENDAQLNSIGKITTTHGIVVSYIDLGNYQQAEKWLEIVLDYDERYISQYHYLKGFISLRRNDLVSAETYLLKSSESRPNAETYYLLGGIYFVNAEKQQSLENYKKAEQYLNESLKKNPSFSRSSLLLAKTYIALGDRQKARANAQNALRNASDQEVVNEARAILQMN